MGKNPTKAVQEKFINLMLRHSEVIEELRTQNITPDYFDERYQPLVQAIYYVHGGSDGKRLLTDDHFRKLLIQQGVKGDITIGMQVLFECRYGVHHANSKDDLDMLVERLTEHYMHREGIGALDTMNKEVKKLGYVEPLLVERLDDGAHVRFRKVESSGDVRDLGSLIRGENNLRTPHLDPVCVTPNHALELSSFGHADVANVQAHNGSPHVTTTSMSTRGNPYIPNETNAQTTYFNRC